MNGVDARTDDDFDAAAHDPANRPCQYRPGASAVAWFGITPAKRRGWRLYVGVVFNRPFEQVLTYHAPIWLSPVIQPGQRLRVPLGRGDDRRLVTASGSIHARPVISSRRGSKRSSRSLTAAVDRSEDARAHALDRRLLCLFVGQALDAVVPAGVKKHAGTKVGTFLIVPEETRDALGARRTSPASPPSRPPCWMFSVETRIR